MQLNAIALGQWHNLFFVVSAVYSCTLHLEEKGEYEVKVQNVHL